MNLFNLIATLVLNNQAYKKGLQESEKEAKSFSSKAGVAFKAVGKAVAAVTGIVATAAGALSKLTLSAINYGDTIADNSVKLGISTDAYQTFTYALNQAGVSSDKLSNYVRFLTQFTQNLAEGNADALITLDKLGIGYEEFMSMGTDDQIKTITSAFQGLEDGMDKTALAQSIWGDRMYQDFMPILSESAEAIEDTEEKLDNLGIRMSKDAVKSADKLSDKFLLVKESMKAVAFNAASRLFPAVNTITDGLLGLIDGSMSTDEALGMIGDGIKELVGTVTEELPELLTGAGTILLDLIPILLDSISDPKFVQGLFDMIETLILKVIDILPSVLKSITTLIPAIIDALINMDWGEIVGQLLIVLIDFITSDLPNMLYSIINSILKLVTSGKIFEMIGKIGIAIGQSVINGLLNAIETGLNFVIDGINKILSIEIAGKKIGFQIPEVSLPRVNWMADGGLMDDLLKMSGGIGTAYAIAGEAGAEVVAQGSKGTGVTNVEQFSDAMFDALERYGFTDLAEAIVNGILSGLTMRLTTNTEQQNITLKIGEKEFKAYVVRAVNEQQSQSGRKSLKQVTGY